MSNDNVVPFGRKVYRRKRRFQGATWTPNTITAAVEDGVWCAAHRIRHGYMSRNLGTTYEKGSDGYWKILWVCQLTGNVLKEERIGVVRVPEGGCGEAPSDGIGTDRIGDGEVDST